MMKPIISADGHDTYRLTENPDLLKKSTKTCRSLKQADQCINELLENQGVEGLLFNPLYLLLNIAVNIS